MKTNLKQYFPYLGMVLAVVLQSVYAAVADDRITGVEALTILIALTGAVTTYVLPRVPGALWVKKVVAGVTGVLVVLLNAASSGGFTTQTWVTAAIQFLVGLGVVAFTDNNTPVAAYEAEHAEAA